jgi:hypothetical protein
VGQHVFKKQANDQMIPVHIHERLSASTDLRLVSPEAVSESRGLGNVRAGISGNEDAGCCC